MPAPPKKVKAGTCIASPKAILFGDLVARGAQMVH